MLITANTLKKLFRSHFSQGSALKADNESQQKQLLDTIKKGIESSAELAVWKDETESYSRYHYHDEKEAVLRLAYQYDSRSRSEEVRLEFKKDLLILFVDYYRSHEVPSIEALYALLADLKKATDEQYAKDLKKSKIKQLKHQAINAKVKALAKAEKFDYYLEEYKTKVKIMVLMNSKILEVDVPYGKFQGVLQELQEFIRSFRKLQESGIGFRFKAVQSYRSYNWVRHEEL